MKWALLKDLLKLLILFGVIWGVFVIFPIFPDKSVLEISLEKEEQLGKIIVDNILANTPGFEEIHTPALDSAIFKISERLIGQIGLTDYQYTIKVIDNTEINAFTLPGGNIFIYSGLLRFADNADEVAAVLAHEIGHVEKRHVVSKLIKEFGINLIFSILTGGDAVMLSELGKTAISTVFDRQQEKEADQYGLDLLADSGISPKSLAAFFRRLKRESGSYDESLEILMTHPHYNSRIKASIQYELPEDYKEVDFGIDWERVINSFSTGKE